MTLTTARWAIRSEIITVWKDWPTWKRYPPETNPGIHHGSVRVAPLSFVRRYLRCALPSPSRVLPSWTGAMVNSEAEKASSHQTVTARTVAPEVVEPEVGALEVIHVRFHYSAIRQ